MLREFLILVYAGVVGFVAAGIAASFYKMVTSQPAKFGRLDGGYFTWASTLLFGAVTGPIIVVDQAIKSRRADRIPVAWVCAGIVVAAMWSCCSGVVVLQLVFALRNSLS